MKYETAEEKFTRKLKYGEDKWAEQPCNGAADQPCLYGCIINKRVAPPLYYSLQGDCRNPSADDCCMNKQFDAEYYDTRAIEKAK